MEKAVEKSGVVTMYMGEFWGIKDEGDHHHEEGWGPIEDAHISNPEFCKKPTDMTFEGSQYEEELRKGHLVNVTRTTTFEVTESTIKRCEFVAGDGYQCNHDDVPPSVYFECDKDNCPITKEGWHYE